MLNRDGCKEREAEEHDPERGKQERAETDGKGTRRGSNMLKRTIRTREKERGRSWQMLSCAERGMSDERCRGRGKEEENIKRQANEG